MSAIDACVMSVMSVVRACCSVSTKSIGGHLHGAGVVGLESLLQVIGQAHLVRVVVVLYVYEFVCIVVCVRASVTGLERERGRERANV